MSHYLYKCSKCSSEYNSDEIEKNLIYLCPRCGNYKKNEPLEGVLSIVYDYETIKRKIDKKFFLQKTPGRIWDYPFILPLDYDNHGIKKVKFDDLNKLNLCSKFITEIKLDENRIKIFDDSRNITLSYKDRASILVVLKAIQLGIKEISTSSTGNAGSSLAGICARMGIESHIFVPKNIPDSKRFQIQSFGSKIYFVDGDYDIAFDLCNEVSSSCNWYNRNTAFNPLTIEGKKSSVFDMFIELGGRLPEDIYVPAGDGVIVSGIYKGLRDLMELGWIENMPRLNIVQASGSDAIIRYLETGKYCYTPADTIADSISAGAPRNLFMAAETVEKTSGKGIRVTDDEILTAQEQLAKRGILCEPAAAAAFAGYMKYSVNTGKQRGDSMIMVTGNGLKDLNSLRKWNEHPIIHSYEEWIYKLKKK